MVISGEKNIPSHIPHDNISSYWTWEHMVLMVNNPIWVTMENFLIKTSSTSRQWPVYKNANVFQTDSIGM